jgi:hypothetical protein
VDEFEGLDSLLREFVIELKLLPFEVALLVTLQKALFFLNVSLDGLFDFGVL